MKHFFIIILAVFLFGCTSKKNEKTIWIYTSLYKDTINDIQPKLEKEFPGYKFNFYQAGSEEVATKVNTEILAKGIQADILISSDRFWYEELSKQKKLLAYRPKGTEEIEASYKNAEGYYSTLSLPVMILAYNSEILKTEEVPKSFKDLELPKWKSKITSGSPLSSGTNFTTMAFLQKKYGWEYFKNLRKNDLIAEGGNSGVIRKLQNKERAIGFVLLENILRLQESDPRIKPIYPEDGVVFQANILGIVDKGPEKTEILQKIADWFFGQPGQEAMIRSYMYSPIPKLAAPKGAPELKELLGKSQSWSNEFIQETISNKDKLKEEFTKIIFQ